jgi:hypothetical protein
MEDAMLNEEVVIDDLNMTVPAFIEYLDRAYPHRCITAVETLENAHRRAGMRELIDHLLELKISDEERMAEERRDGRSGHKTPKAGTSTQVVL